MALTVALTAFQRDLCRLIASHRIAQGESYVAGGAALGVATGSPRISRDVDLFHDTDEALVATWNADRRLLVERGYSLTIVRERPTFIEASVAKGGDSVLMQWTRDSAYRFFPLVSHEEFGLTLHPVDLATNKVLALVGRLEVRDWVDIVYCHERIQRLGYLVWAACGKDPGFSPQSIVEQAKRSGRYTQQEVALLSFEGPPPDARRLAGSWHAMLREAEELISALPPEAAGTCVMDREGKLYSGAPAELLEQLRAGALRFHAGSIRGSFPQIVERGAG
jgi:hypothetical protein